MSNRLISNIWNIAGGDLSPLGGPTLDETVAGRVRAEQLSLVLRYLPSMMLANACNAFVFVAAAWPSPDRLASLIWATPLVVYTLFFGIWFRRKPITPQTVSARSIRRVSRNALLLGSLWATLPLFFFIGASAVGQLIITCLCAGLLAAGAIAFASLPITAIAFTSPIFIASAIVIARSGDQAYSLVAVLLVAYVCLLMRGVLFHTLQLVSRVSDQSSAEEQAHTDSLTQLPNRISFRKALDSALSCPKNVGEQIAVLYLDLDDFKSVNDKLGHAEGDELLAQVAERLKAHARTSDTLARLSGDEFAILVRDIKNAEEALALAERVLEAFRLPFVIDGLDIYNAVSIGIAMAPATSVSSALLLKNADTALYRAKGDAGGSVQLFQPDHDVRARERRAIERDLRLALSRDEFFLVFQPVLDLARNQTSGCEALIRWKHPIRGVITPSEFIRIAEGTELIHSVGEWVIGQACRAASTWPSETKVAVNISAVQLRHSRTIAIIANALARAGLNPSRLEIEITESAILSNNDFALSTLNALRALGIKCALDDFGTGYASLSCLRKFPFDRVKIDQSIVRDMLSDRGCASIVKSVIELAYNLGISVTAEGVERQEELSYLRSTTCDEVQGFLVSAPRTAAEIVAMFSKSRVSSTRAA